MLWVPPPSLTKRWTSLAGGDPSSATPGISFTTGATPNAKTGWQELTSGLAFDLYRLRLMIYGNSVSGTNTATLLDVGLGASSSEQVLFPNWVCGARQTTFTNVLGPTFVEFPVFVPASTRISCRAQCGSNQTVRVVAEGDGDCSRPTSLWAARRVVAYGADTSDSGAVAVATGGSNAEGNWVEITSATTEDHAALMIGLGIDPGDTGLNSATCAYVDVGIGGAGSEEVIAENFIAVWSNQEVFSFLSAPVIWRHVASGTRLAVRVSSIATADTVTVALYGLS